MLRHEENMALCQVGPKTPMGRFMRRYWIPAAKTEQIKEAGGAPVRVRLLGENLVAFRDPKGRPGLMHFDHEQMVIRQIEPREFRKRRFEFLRSHIGP